MRITSTFNQQFTSGGSVKTTPPGRGRVAFKALVPKKVSPQFESMSGRLISEVGKFLASPKDTVKFLGSGVSAAVYMFLKFPQIVIKQAFNQKETFEDEQQHLQMVPDEVTHSQRFGAGFFDDETGRHYLVSTLVRGNSADLSENPWTKKHFDSLFETLYEMDKVGLYHGDLNNGNLKLTRDGEVNIIDWQWAQKIPYGQFFDEKDGLVQPGFLMPDNAQMFEMKDFSLEGKVALITGASYGIGFAIATAYAKAGATIVFNDIKQELVDKGLAAYKEAGIEAHGYVCDVTDEDAVNAFVAKVEEEVGTIDILVNNAGIIKRIPMLEMSAKDFRQVIDIDLNGPFIVSKAVIPGMIKKGHGKIINICSMMSELGRETVSAYAAAKGGLKMLTRNICSEYGEHNIQCNGIGPGYIATPQTAPLREKQPDGSRHPFDQFIVSKTPAARWGEPQDLMGPAVFLASDASNFVNGHVLYVDGGILAYIGKQPE